MNTNVQNDSLQAYCTKALEACLRRQEDGQTDTDIDLADARVLECISILKSQICKIATHESSSPKSFRAATHKILSELLPSLRIELRRNEVREQLLSKLLNGDITVHNMISNHAEYTRANQEMFVTITDHHRSLIEQVDEQHATWEQAISSKQAIKNLAKYAQAAVSMGDKEWVRKGQQTMEAIALQFFFENGAENAYIKSRKAIWFDRHNNFMPTEEQLRLRGALPKLIINSETERIRLLDVGSCYNPHLGQQKFDVTALDLEPTHESVYQCDFLALTLAETSSIIATPREGTREWRSDQPASQRLKALPGNYFHAVTFSLVLNYLPSSDQRVEMLIKARELLISPPESDDPAGAPHRSGLLLILEKGSVLTASGSRSSMLLWSWKAAICALGFELVTYQLLNTDGRKCHIFAFRTVTRPASGQLRLPLYCKHELENLSDEEFNEAMSIFGTNNMKHKASAAAEQLKCLKKPRMENSPK